jgi:hypothetical protein
VPAIAKPHARPMQMGRREAYNGTFAAVTAYIGSPAH